MGLFLFATALLAAQLSPGPGNPQAEEIARSSEIVLAAWHLDIEQAQKITDPRLRTQTHSALIDPTTCVAHRANLTTAARQQIVHDLLAAHLLNPADDDTFPGGLINGVFPPVLDDNSSCPHLPQPFYAAPGSTFDSHHSYPGGLAIHEANNDLAAVNWAAQYRRLYGVMAGNSTLYIDQDLVLAAPLWHDWAKTIVMQWNADGTIFKELSIAGTGAHHVLSLAETMARGLSPVFIDVQACAHSAPTVGNEAKVVSWIRAAAIIARQDPVAKGYLIQDATGAYHLPAFRKTGSFDLLKAGQANFLVEMTIHNLSDSDWTYGIAAVTAMQSVLSDLAPRYAVDPVWFRNTVFAHCAAESLYLTYTQKGIDGVRESIDRLRNSGYLKRRTMGR